MKRLTDAQLDELARLEAGATPGPLRLTLDPEHECWQVLSLSGASEDLDGAGVHVADFYDGNCVAAGPDVRLYAAARNAFPALLAELRLLRALAEAAGHLSPPQVQYAASLKFEVAMNAWLRWKAQVPQ